MQSPAMHLTSRKQQCRAISLIPRAWPAEAGSCLPCPAPPPQSPLQPLGLCLSPNPQLLWPDAPTLPCLSLKNWEVPRQMCSWNRGCVYSYWLLGEVWLARACWDELGVSG